MKFVMSYSCGKDSTLALHKMVEAGHTPVALLVMFHEGQERSWFHGVDRPLLERIAAALELPLLLCPSTGEAYHLAFEEGLRWAMAMGRRPAFSGLSISRTTRRGAAPAVRRWACPPAFLFGKGTGWRIPGRR